MNRASAIFCLGSLALCLGLAWLFFPMATLDAEVIEAYRVPQPAETMDLIDVGGGFGQLPAVELIGYYIENPPVVEAGAAAAPEIRFGGC